MGQFSWFTMDTNHRIVNEEEHEVYLVDDKGNKWKETCYEGYGVFGGKDIYILIAEMNGYSHKDYEDNSGVVTCPDGHEVGTYNMIEDLRHIGIELAFGVTPEGKCKYPKGDNPNIKWPSITESGKYIDGMPTADPNQGFSDYGNEEEEDWL